MVENNNNNNDNDDDTTTKVVDEKSDKKECGLSSSSSSSSSSSLMFKISKTLRSFYEGPVMDLEENNNNNNVEIGKDSKIDKNNNNNNKPSHYEESTPLLLDTNKPLEDWLHNKKQKEMNQKKMKTFWTICSMFVTTVLLIGFITSQYIRVHNNKNSYTNSGSGSKYGKKDMIFDATNDYIRRDGRLGKPYTWVKDRHVIEPYRLTCLTVRYTKHAKENENNTFSWSIDDKKYVGEQIFIQFNTTGEFNVIVSEVNAQTMLPVHTFSDTIVVKYVRRELRSLTVEDREAFFNAAKVIYTVSLKEGQALYGKDFYDIDFFTRLHGKLAADETCDHIHDGLGFLPFHIAYTLKFEKALQSVNPLVTVPYWDYSIETDYIKKQLDGNYTQHWFKSQVWDADWFGRPDPVTNIVTEGRFAYTKVIDNAWDNEPHNSYGFLRAPWNNNNSPYVTRSSHMCGANFIEDFMGSPTCKAIYNLINNKQYDTFENFAWFLPGAPHGPVHILTGGLMGCEESYSTLYEVGFPKHFVNSLRASSFVAYKNYYRSGLLECPEKCNIDTPLDDCKCSCVNKFDTELDNTSNQEEYDAVIRKYADKLYMRKNIRATFYQKYNNTQIITLVKTACSSSTTMGEQLEAASPLDISFWPIHPTVERMYQARKLKKGFFSDHSWPEGRTSIYGNTCTGHQKDSELLMPGITKTGTTSDKYTNYEFLNEFMDPESGNHMDYIYDNFDWDHCNEYDWNISNMLVPEKREHKDDGHHKEGGHMDGDKDILVHGDGHRFRH